MTLWTKLKGLVGGSASETEGQGSPDLKAVDAYLKLWNQFATERPELGPKIGQGKPGFEAALTRLLMSGDDQAVTRLVFYMVVQVGGSIAVDSELGKAAASVLGSDFPVSVMADGLRNYYAGDLYFFWRAHDLDYPVYSMLAEWCYTEFARTVVIPMYTTSASEALRPKPVPGQVPPQDLTASS